ncbi:MAG: DMT family transporter [bacterium]
MFLIVFLWATLAATFIFAKKALIYSSPAFLIGIRMIVAGGFLLAYQWFKHNKKAFIIQKKDYLTFFLVSLFHIYLAFMFEFWALQYVSALKTTIIFSATPFVSALLAYFLLKERLSKIKLIGICVGLFGLVPTLLAQASGVEAHLELFRISLPEIVLLLAVISGAYAWFIVIKLMNRGYNLGFINGVAMLVGGLLCMITAILTRDLSHPVSQILPFMGWLTLLIISANFIFYNLYAWMLKKYSVTFLSFSGFLCPCFATLYDWLFMGGSVTWHYFASLVLIILGLYIFYREELKNLRVKNLLD